MTYSPIIISRILSALVIACAMAAFTAQPAAAQTAKKLKCNGCVKTKQLKNNGIKSKDIKNGQVKSGDLANGAVTGPKIQDGAVTLDKLSSDALAAGRVPLSECGPIDQPGSYLVVDNLGPAGLDADGNCLVVNASFVTIDLGGFVLTGNGTGAGVRVPGQGLQDVTVRNGTATGFSNGVELRGARPSLVEAFRAVDNTAIGIDADSQSTVRDSISTDNGGAGISPSGPCVITDNFVRNNGSTGLSLSSGCLASGNVVTDNVGTGISAGTGSVVSGNVARDNGGVGLSIGCPSVVTGNASLNNAGGNLSLNGAGCAAANNAAPP